MAHKFPNSMSHMGILNAVGLSGFPNNALSPFFLDVR